MSLATYIPALRYAKWLGLAVLLGAVGVQTLRLNMAERDAAEIQAAWDAEKARADAVAREQEHAAAVAAKEANDAKDKEVARARAAAAGARDELGRLRSAIATLDAAQPPGAPASATGRPDDASIARSVVGSCAQSLAAVAEAADACESRVIGLQGYIRAIQPAP